MRWSIKIGKIFGIDFKIHITFLWLLLFIYLVALSQKGSGAAIMAVLFICAVFACVLIHEIGHSLIARRFGEEAKSITLLPIGGVATMEEMPEKPIQEIAMAIVGPFINLAIAGLLFILLGSETGVSYPDLYPNSWQGFFAGLIGVNIILAIFNLIPAFPMDGGRVLRGILALKMEYTRATSVAVLVGQAVATLFIFYGIFFNWWLALIGVFIYIGAGSEKQHVMLRTVLHRVPAGEATTTDFRILKPDDPLSRALEHVHHGCQEDFPVIGNKGLEGILTRIDILSALHSKGTEVQVSNIMDRDFISVDSGMPLDETYHRLLSGHKTTAAVFDHGQFKGMLCLESISRYFMFQNALKKTQNA